MVIGATGLMRPLGASRMLLSSSSVVFSSMTKPVAFKSVPLLPLSIRVPPPLLRVVVPV